MKIFIVSLILVVFSATQSFSGELVGNKAKKIVMDGEVLGMVLFDDALKKGLNAKLFGLMFTVKHKRKLYICFNYDSGKESVWRCVES